VLAGFEHCFNHEFARLAAGLSWISGKYNQRMKYHMKTYTNDGNILDMVLEALWLLAGIFLRHT
jgi:hypothetical protein